MHTCSLFGLSQLLLGIYQQIPSQLGQNTLFCCITITITVITIIIILCHSCCCHRQAVQSVSSSFQEASCSVAAQGGPVRDAIVDVLSDRCLTVLRQLRGISATYRMTAR